MRHYLLATLFILTLAGCDAVSTMKNGLEQSNHVSTDLEKKLGSKPQVGFNWNNGSLRQVTVMFDAPLQEHNIAEISDAVRIAISKEFKQKPERIVLSFAITPNP